MHYKNHILATILSIPLFVGGCEPKQPPANPKASQPIIKPEYMDKSGETDIESSVVYNVALTLERARQNEMPIEQVFGRISGKPATAKNEEFFHYKESSTGEIMQLRVESVSFNPATSVYTEKVSFWRRGTRIDEEENNFIVGDILRKVLEKDGNGLVKTGVSLSLKTNTGEYSILENLVGLLEQNGGDIHCFEEAMTDYSEKWETGRKDIQGFNSYLDRRLGEGEIKALKLLRALESFSSGAETRSFDSMVSEIFSDVEGGEFFSGNSFTKAISGHSYDKIVRQFMEDYKLERKDFLHLQFSLVNQFDLQESRKNLTENKTNLEKNIGDLGKKSQTLSQNIGVYNADINTSQERLDWRGKRWFFGIAGNKERISDEERSYQESLISKKRGEIARTETEMRKAEGEMRETVLKKTEAEKNLNVAIAGIAVEEANAILRQKGLEGNTSINQLEFFLRSEHRNEDVTAELERRIINLDDPRRVMEIYNLKWKRSNVTWASLKVPYERIVDPYSGKILAADPGILDRMGITLQSFGHDTRSKLDGFTELVRELQSIEKYGMRPRVKSIVTEAMKFIENMKKLDEAVGPVKLDTAAEMSPVEDIPLTIRESKNSDPGWIDRYRQIRNKPEIKAVEANLTLTDVPVETLGRKIGRALYRSGYFDNAQRITSEKRPETTFDANRIDKMIQSLTSGIEEELEQFIEMGDPGRRELLKKEFLEPLKDKEELIPNWKVSE